MSDTLATINVEQLSSAVNAAVQAAANCRLPLDPSPPPDGGITPRAGGQMATSSGLPKQGCPGRAVLSLPTEITIPVSAIPSAQLTMPMTVSRQSPTCALTPQTNGGSSTNGPLVLQVNIPNSSRSSTQIQTLSQIQGNAPPSLMVQPQAAGRQVFMLKQVGNNTVLVPAPSKQSSPAPALTQCPAGRVIAGAAGNTIHLAAQPVSVNGESGLYPSSCLLQSVNGNTHPTVYSQSASLPPANSQQSSLINMNIAIHLPQNGSTPQTLNANQLGGRGGVQIGYQPVAAQATQDSTRLLSHIVNVPSATAQVVQSNPGQLVVLPNPPVVTQMQTQPVNPHAATVPRFTFITPNTGRQLEYVQLCSSANANAPTASSIVSPTPNSVSQSRMPFPLTLTPQKPSHMPCGQAGGLHLLVDSQPASAKSVQRRAVRNSAEDNSVGRPRRQPTIQAIISNLRERSLTTNADDEVKSSASLVRRGKHQQDGCPEDCWRASTESMDGESPNQGPSTIIEDKPVETRARQSLPDILCLKQSSIYPSAMGVFTKKTIQPNTRFGPLVGRLTNVHSSRCPTSMEPSAWRIFSDGKLCQILHTDDERTSNWMMFIQVAGHRGQHNLLAFQQGSLIYFTSPHLIASDQELVVWYSEGYSRLRGTQELSSPHGLKEKPEEPAKCRQCSQKFPHHSQLAHHLRKDHPDPEDRRRLKCELCPRSFPSTTKLNMHLLVHMGVKPHHCQVCGKGFTDRSNMRAHLLIHDGVKQFSCSVCHKSFRQRVHLKSHEFVHTGERKLQCPVCKRAFGRRSDLSYHIKQHTERKRAHCEVCSASFWKESQLNRHMKIHTGEKDFQCHLCGKGFITNYHLNRHLRSCEREERFRRRPWPRATASNGEAGSPSEDAVPRGERRQSRVQCGIGHKETEEQTSAPRVLRSSRGRPLRPKPLPDDTAFLECSPSRSRRKPKPATSSRRSAHTSASGERSPSIFSVCEVERSDSHFGQAAGQPCSDGQEQFVSPRRVEVIRRVAVSGNPQSSVSLYGVHTDSLQSRVPAQQPSSPLSQLALSVRQQSSMTLDCDAYTPSSAVTQSQIESGYTYTTSASASEIHESALSTPLFDLGEGTSMSSSTQSISAYNSQAFSLTDAHSESFSEPQDHSSATQSMFMTDGSMVDSAAGASTQTCLPDHSAPTTSLNEDSLFSIDPSEESNSTLPPPPGDGMSDMTVDLHAIEGALDSEDEEQCTNERRGDSPSEHVEE